MKACGLLGRSLGHSYSPAIHKALTTAYHYSLFEIEPEGLSAFLQEGRFDGLNVTIPYKTAVIPYCAKLSSRAREIGSVNTLIRREDGSLYGDNTDALGFATMLHGSGITVRGKKVLVLGSGGASLTVCHVLQEEGAGEVVVISRSGENHYGTLSKHEDAQIIVNTTPVGMYPDTGASPVELARFPHCEGVLDLIYNPARTLLMLEARRLGIPCCGGLSMLVGQAKAAAELFSGHEIREARVKEVIRQLCCQMENLVLIGMPGCGKSTIGRQLAASLGRSFVDSDEIIEQRAGMTIPELFETEGEEGFRLREEAVLQDFGRRSALVLSTGGGCVTRPANEQSLRQNGILVFVERELSLLEREGRPLSQGVSLEALYAKRLPLYRSFADVSVKNDAPPEQVAARIWEAVYEVLGD